MVGCIFCCTGGERKGHDKFRKAGVLPEKEGSGIFHFVKNMISFEGASAIYPEIPATAPKKV